MKKKVLLSIEEEALQKIDSMAREKGYDRSAFYVYLAENIERRVILPKNTTGKDELAKLLGIGQLDKEYSLFEDRITEERVYNPNKIRTSW